MIQCAFRLRAALGSAMILAAYGCGDDARGETAVSRSFDELARDVASCAGDYRGCNDAGVGVGTAQACASAFRDCRASAGTDALNSLAIAIAGCEDRADVCREKASAADEGLDAPCAQSLRACIGETSDRVVDNPGRNYTRPNPYASAYPCFGQLQECAAAATSPTKCAASAKTCVIDLVGEPPSRSTSARPIDAGVRTSEAGSMAPGGR